MRHHRKLIAVLLVGASARAAADTGSGSGSAAPPVIIHLKSDADCVSTKGSHFQLPPGYELDEPTWAARDAEYRRLQDAETRLSAENASYKASASDSHIGLIVSVVTAAFAAGYLLGK